jgi:hypothetical protein
MEIRFHLNPDLDAKLIEKILIRAGENRPSAAAKIMMREWSYAEDVKNLSSSSQKLVTSTSNEIESDMQDTINLSGLDAAFSELGE